MFFFALRVQTVNDNDEYNDVVSSTARLASAAQLVCPPTYLVTKLVARIHFNSTRDINYFIFLLPGVEFQVPGDEGTRTTVLIAATYCSWASFCLPC